jgi:hypothetical protein
MVERKIVWTKTASQQLEEVVLFWNAHNGNNLFSQKILKATNASAKRLIRFPFSGKLTDFPSVRAIILLKSFTLFYKVMDSKVLILLFWDSRQDPDKIKRVLPTT